MKNQNALTAGGTTISSRTIHSAQPRAGRTAFHARDAQCWDSADLFRSISSLSCAVGGAAAAIACCRR
jgi:hypothetical protein